MQEAQAGIKGCAAPGFNGMVAGVINFLQHGQHINDAHTCCGDGLVSVTQDGFYDFYRFVCHALASG